MHFTCEHVWKVVWNNVHLISVMTISEWWDLECFAFNLFKCIIDVSQWVV